MSRNDYLYLAPVRFCEAVLYRGVPIDDFKITLTIKPFGMTIIGELVENSNGREVYIRLSSAQGDAYEKYVEALVEKFDPDQEIMTSIIESRTKSIEYCPKGIKITDVGWDGDGTLLVKYDIL